MPSPALPSVPSAAPVPLPPASHATHVLVVGGDASFARQTIAPNLQRLGLHGKPLVVDWTWPYDKQMGEAIPKGCDLVIVMTDMLGHSNEAQVCSLANKAGVRIIRGTRKWGESLPRYLDQGLKMMNTEPVPVAKPAPAAVKATTPPRLDVLGEANRLAWRMDTAYRVLAANPLARNEDVTAAVAAAAKEKFPGVNAQAVHGSHLAEMRTRLGLRATAGNEGHRRVYVDVDRYTKECAQLQVPPAVEHLVPVSTGMQPRPGQTVSKPVRARGRRPALSVLGKLPAEVRAELLGARLRLVRELLAADPSLTSAELAKQSAVHLREMYPAYVAAISPQGGNKVYTGTRRALGIRAQGSRVDMNGLKVRVERAVHEPAARALGIIPDYSRVRLVETAGAPAVPPVTPASTTPVPRKAPYTVATTYHPAFRIDARAHLYERWIAEDPRLSAGEIQAKLVAERDRVAPGTLLPVQGSDTRRLADARRRLGIDGRKSDFINKIVALDRPVYEARCTVLGVTPVPGTQPAPAPVAATPVAIVLASTRVHDSTLDLRHACEIALVKDPGMTNVSLAARVGASPVSDKHTFAKARKNLGITAEQHGTKRVLRVDKATYAARCAELGVIPLPHADAGTPMPIPAPVPSMPTPARAPTPAPAPAPATGLKAALQLFIEEAGKAGLAGVVTVDLATGKLTGQVRVVRYEAFTVEA